MVFIDYFPNTTVDKYVHSEANYHFRCLYHSFFFFFLINIEIEVVIVNE